MGRLPQKVTTKKRKILKFNKNDLYVAQLAFHNGMSANKLNGANFHNYFLVVTYSGEANLETYSSFC